jgi:hypothetical protein
MNLLKLPRVYREALAMHEALRRLGVQAEHIFVAVSAKREVIVLVSNADLKDLEVAAIEDVGERDQAISVAVGDAPDDFEEVWPEACLAWRKGPERELKQIWDRSLARRNAPALIVALDLGAVRRCPSTMN